MQTFSRPKTPCTALCLVVAEGLPAPPIGKLQLESLTQMKCRKTKSSINIVQLTNLSKIFIRRFERANIGLSRFWISMSSPFEGVIFKEEWWPKRLVNEIIDPLD